eukprot:2985921-Pyramimonas_sp.AAC.1
MILTSRIVRDRPKQISLPKHFYAVCGLEKVTVSSQNPDAYLSFTGVRHFVAPFAAPNSISAQPATSASFATCTRLLPVSFIISSSAFTPIHSFEIFAAVKTSPRRIAAGNPTPIGPFQLK